MNKRRFVMATPIHTDYYAAYAETLEATDRLRLALQWKFRGYRGIPKQLNKLCPPLGAVVYAAAKIRAGDFAQAVRFSMHPAFDRWCAMHLKEGDHVLSSYGYANRTFHECRKRGGKTFLDGGNSHPEYSWNLLTKEYAKWNCSDPPVPRAHYERSLAMMEDVDYVLAPSGFVAQSFLEKGFSEKQILRMFYPLDLSIFKPTSEPRPADRPFTVVNTGGLSLRKGTPYLLESLRILHRRIPNMRILLSNLPADNIRPILAKYSDLPIEWSDYLNQEMLAERLRSADIFILPSLEEGLVRTALQAMACGLPVVLTPNTGTNDYVVEGVNGSIVPLFDAKAIADASEMWWEKIRQGYRPPTGDLCQQLNKEKFQDTVDSLLTKVGF